MINIEKYKIYNEEIDFDFKESEANTKGTRRKKIVLDKENNKAYFKYEMYNCSESCSEKMSYEIAKVLGYKCARIELAKDKNGVLGILNYFFTIDDESFHHDAIDFINKEQNEMKKYYTIDNIKNKLDELDKSLFDDFLKIMLFDALVGETDRHQENWGITIANNKYSLSPLYDNGTNLLSKFKDINYAEKYYNKTRNFDAYIMASRTQIYDNFGRKYKHFDLMKELYKKYPKQIIKEIKNLDKLNDEKINNIVNKIPDDLLTEMQKKYIIDYLKKRKEILKNIMK